MSTAVPQDLHNSWTTKYSLKSIKDIIGNINIIKDAVRYLKNYKSEKSPRADFPKAILISGPTGTGKTEFAKLLALYRGFIPMEFSAALLRKKKEIEECIDVYKSDIRRNFSPNHPFVIQALRNLDATNMTKLGVGKAIVIDELDAISKEHKGCKRLLTGLMAILKSKKGHDPRSVIIMTCDEKTLNSKLKSVKNYCHVLKFKKISNRELLKLVTRICKNEKIVLTNDDKQRFVNYSNGDCRRLINSMELCFKNGIGNYTSKQLSEMIQCFINNDHETIQRLKYSMLSSEKILHKVIETSIQSKADKKVSVFDVVPLIEKHMDTLGQQLYKTYPLLIRKDINSVKQLDLLSRAMEEISHADNFMDRIREAAGYDNGYAHSGYFISQGVLSPLHILRKGMSKNFHMDVNGYAKINGINRTINSQLSIKSKIGYMIPFLSGSSMDDIRFFASFIAKQLKEDKHSELAAYFHTYGIDPTVIDDLEKIKSPFPKFNGMHLGVELKDVWKGPTKRKFKKQFIVVKPKVQGVKFKDEKPTKKIQFFERFEKPKKKQKTNNVPIEKVNTEQESI